MKQDDKMFLLGLLSLLCSLFLFPFAAYLFPAVWLGWEYQLPGFVVDTSIWIQTVFDTNYTVAFRWFFRMIFVLAIGFGVAAYLIAHHISQMQAAEEKNKEMMEEEVRPKLSTKAKQTSKESFRFFLKMVVIISLVFIVASMIQWAISLPTAAS
ncbi:MAG: hypothetical protein P1U32_07475 [Legionellaceae bacterium]|nr:hypothetical protein [Legionellaceae bacterium]